MTESRRRWIAHALTSMLVVAFGLQLAWWFWQFAAPAAKSVDSANPAELAASAVDAGVARQLFGGSGAARTTAGSDIHLKGVYAADGKTLSAAVLNLGGRDLAVSVGNAISDKVTLAEVHADHIVVSRAGVRERIDLESYRSATRQTVAAAPGGFRLNVNSTGNQAYTLSRQELNNVLQDPRQLEFLGRIGTAPSGGIRIDDAPPNSLSGKLGLRSGDIITSINGQVVASPGDLARFYQQFGTLTAIRAEVKRGGVPMMLTYSIQQ